MSGYHEDIAPILEIHLCDYLDESAESVATAFKDIFGRDLNDIEAEAIAGLIEKRLASIEVVW